jgi:hypothetical protein
MKTINSRKLAMLFGGILAATLAAGCYGGGDSGYGYSNGPYGGGYSSNYSSYGNSYPYSGYNSGYSYPQNNGNSYNAGYQNGVRADANRDRHEDRDQHVTVSRDVSKARVETHSTVARENVSRKESAATERSEKN